MTWPRASHAASAGGSRPRALLCEAMRPAGGVRARFTAPFTSWVDSAAEKRSLHHAVKPRRPRPPPGASVAPVSPPGASVSASGAGSQDEVVPLEELCGKRFAAPAAALRMMGLLGVCNTRAAWGAPWRRVRPALARLHAATACAAASSSRLSSPASSRPRARRAARLTDRF